MRDQPPSLPPVPVPFRQRWREFRIQALPLVAFLIIGTLASALWQQVVVPDPVNPREPSQGASGPDCITINDDLDKLEDPSQSSSRTNGIVDSYSPRD